VLDYVIRQTCMEADDSTVPKPPRTTELEVDDAEREQDDLVVDGRQVRGFRCGRTPVVGRPLEELPLLSGRGTGGTGRRKPVAVEGAGAP